MLRLLEGTPRSFSDVDEKMQNLRKDRRGKTMGDIYIENGRFALVRDDYERIKNTFEFLEQYGNREKDFGTAFVETLAGLLSRCAGKKGILKFAYFLDGGLFSGITVSTNPSTSELRMFQKKPRKRLWMFIMFLRRDPAVLNLFREALTEVCDGNVSSNLFNTWEDVSRFDPKEVELPGDMWNVRLFAALLSELPSFLEKSPKDARVLARELATRYSISPSAFDVTFELGANRCRSLECDQCPFGENNLCHKGTERACSISEWLFPYYEKDSRGEICSAKDCPIAKDIGKNICSRQVDREVQH